MGDANDDRVRFDDLEVGDEVVTHSRTLTEADVREFAGVSGDFNPLHLSESYTADLPFGEPIAHGALLFAVTTGLLWQHRHERPETVAFYGVDSLRFTEPVTMGTTVHAESELLEKEPRDHPVGSGLARYETRLVADDGSVALSCELLTLVK
ncbi:MaoC/PaaZ C-terminal domain-containing protein [Natronococcus sp. A-GB7]|uniref:MaoC/PaaZ C-terminal domain-containing protein n=1 Tax=Natronococcus sp. A-GB7 TaxID=3037649 RepID=UPI00241C94BD|nr:MaoC/PaaZ C-terminal domain-containing protein [Natronococcus sp. A-GB7]MDG5821095.1 MaoC/PaaZ C-terminal domain-containing protein [Natronococcus sp. A-GB7]